MKLIALIHEDENGDYWAEVPALPGCISGGDTLTEASANISEAAEGLIAIIREDINLKGASPDLLPLANLLAKAEPDEDPAIYNSVLAYNYFQLFSTEFERIRIEMDTTGIPHLAELAI